MCEFIRTIIHLSTVIIQNCLAQMKIWLDIASHIWLA